MTRWLQPIRGWGASSRYLSRHSPSSPSSSSSLDFLVIHPRVRWGDGSPSSKLRDPERQLAEAVTLVGSLPTFRVVKSVMVGTDYNTRKARLWGMGRQEQLLELKQSLRVSAVMVNVDVLSPLQQCELHSLFSVPIFDRFNIVLSLFKMYARSEVARLQIALAEIPYLKARLRHLHEDPRLATALNLFAVSEQAAVEDGEGLRQREQSLRKQLREAVAAKLEHDSLASYDFPSVAVVGYTNAGKTSLIKRLTGSPSLQPLNRLFATLDTSLHSARLPSGRPINLADTIGFMYDLPLHLLAAFDATLAHLTQATVIVHIRDISNADWQAQNEEVRLTLDRLRIPANIPIIDVDNKIDLGGGSGEWGAVRVSCETGEGIDQLISAIDSAVLSSTNCSKKVIALRFDSPAIQWLYREGFVMEEPEATPTHLKFTVHMTNAEFARFRSNCDIRLKEGAKAAPSFTPLKGAH